MKKAMIILLAGITILGLMIPAVSCTETTVIVPTPRPTPGVTPPVSLPINNEWDAESIVMNHIMSLAVTYHGKQVLADMVDGWGHGPCSQDYDLSWNVSIWLDNFEVEGNTLLEPIFKDSSRYCQKVGETSYYSLQPGNPCFQGDSDYGVKYVMAWHITPKGEVSPANGNAIRLEAELTK